MMKWAVSTAFAGIALLVSGCAGNSRAEVDRPAPASSSAGADAGLVLRMTTTGGFAGLGGPGTIPHFSLYGDGRAIVAIPALTEYHLTPQAFRRLIAAARDAGLATPRTVDDPKVADAMYDVITFVSDGRARTTKVIQAGGKADPARDFLAKLNAASWPRTDLTGEPRPYKASRVAVLALPSAGSAPAWPLSPLASGSHVGTRTCTVLSGADAGKAKGLAAGGTRWSDHGQTFRVTVRPLLPDESGCASLSH